MNQRFFLQEDCEHRWRSAHYECPGGLSKPVLVDGVVTVSARLPTAKEVDHPLVEFPVVVRLSDLFAALEAL